MVVVFQVKCKVSCISCIYLKRAMKQLPVLLCSRRPQLTMTNILMSLTKTCGNMAVENM